MKTLFFIAALIASVFLVLQTPAGQSWLADSEPNIETEHSIEQAFDVKKEIQKVEQMSRKVAQSVEKKVTEFAQHLNQDQQTQINQLETRIAELENELIMNRVAKEQLNPVIAQPVIEQPAEQEISSLPKPQGITLGLQSQHNQSTTADKKLQQNRQARLQDIAEKMEISSLQALVN